MKAGKIAVQRLNFYLEKGITFNQETTLCGHTIFRTVQKAKKLGYTVEMHYVGVDSPKIARQRVAERVMMGGHGIPDTDIEKRYVESLSNLKEFIKLSDLTALYDNTVKFRRFAIFKNGKIVRLSGNLPDWYVKLNL